MPKIQNSKRVWNLGFRISDLFRISNFEFRASRPAGAGFTPLTGFTLIEIIVALALLAGALTGPLTLATSGLFSSKFSKDKLIAINLAQEGLEIIHAYRDNNMLAGLNFDAGMVNGGNGLGAISDVYYDIYDCGTPPPPSTACIPPTQGVQTSSAPLKLDPDTGIYSYKRGSDSPFTRAITIDRVSGDPVWVSGTLPPAPAADRIRVVSTVTWSDSGVSRQVQLEEELYNWN